jgi:hypothetical protein
MAAYIQHICFLTFLRITLKRLEWPVSNSLQKMVAEAAFLIFSTALAQLAMRQRPPPLTLMETELIWNVLLLAPSKCYSFCSLLSVHSVVPEMSTTFVSIRGASAFHSDDGEAATAFGDDGGWTEVQLEMKRGGTELYTDQDKPCKWATIQILLLSCFLLPTHICRWPPLPG